MRTLTMSRVVLLALALYSAILGLVVSVLSIVVIALGQVTPVVALTVLGTSFCITGGIVFIVAIHGAVPD